MENKEKTTKLLLKYQDHFQIGFQLDQSFQRACMFIKDKAIQEELNKEGACFGRFSFELFRNEDDQKYDIFDHLSFLKNIHKYYLSPSYYCTDGRRDDTNMGLSILLKNDDLVTRLEEAIEEKIGELKLRLLDDIGGRYDFNIDNFKEGKDKKVEYHEKEVSRLQKKMEDYKETSEKYKDLGKEIKLNKRIIKIIK